MKKITIIGVIALSMLSLTACSSNKETSETKPSTTKSSEVVVLLEINDTIYTNSSGMFTIAGKTSPNTKVKINYGKNDESIISDEDGKFESEQYGISEQYDSYPATIIAISSTGTETKREITVKRSSGSIENNNAEKAKKQKEEEAKKQAEEQAKADEKNPATYPELPYDEMARNGNNHKGEKLKITGKVRQVMDTDSGDAMLRVATSANGYDDMYLVQIPASEWNNHRLLEDDVVSFYGNVYGLYTYDSTLGGKITVPALMVNMY